MKNLLNPGKLAFFLFFAAFIVILPGSKISAQNSEIDPTFNPAVTKDVTSNVTGNLSVQPDGKILIFGVFQSGGTYLIRLNTDGTADTSFNCAVCNTMNVYSALALADGKIVVAGFTGVPKVFRLNSDGSLDSSFSANVSSGLSFTTDIEIVAAQPDGKIFVRQRSSWQGFTLQEIIRYNADGNRDSSFAVNSYGPARFSQANFSRIVVLPSGKILMGGTISNGPSLSGFLTRANADGTRDTSFEPPTFTDSNDNRSAVGSFDVFPDGSIIVPGKFTSVNSVSKTDLVRILPAGNVDLNFTPDSLFAPYDVYGGRVFVLPDGKFLVSTVAFNWMTNASSNNRIYRFNSNGTVDNAFNHTDQLTSSAPLALDSANRVLVFGVLSGITRFLRLNTDGSLDSSFNPSLTKKGIVTEMAVQTDGKILTVGDFNRVNGITKNNFARVNPDGTLDAAFDSGSGFDVAPKTLAVQPDGKILALGSFTSYNGTSRTQIARINSDGSLDNSFNPQFNSYLNAIAPLANGKILVGGAFTTVNGAGQARLARLNSDGSLDASFNPIIGSGEVSSILIQSNGQIMIGGSFTGVNGFNRSNLVRLNTDGTMDASFNAAVSPNTQIIQQPNGKYLILHSCCDPSIERRNNDGSADAGFQNITSTGGIYKIFLQADGKILVGGAFSSPGPNIARYLSNGSLETTFFPTGANNTVYTIVGQSDGKILVGGNFISIGNVLRSGIARISASLPRAVFDYDGDGRADVSVFRPSENKWYVLRSSDGVVGQQIFAIAGDVPVPADYDGDGKTDYAIFRPSSGDWWYLSSINNQQVFAHWGQSGDIPRPSDFDGDGKIDFVLFRPSNSFWYRISSRPISTATARPTLPFIARQMERGTSITARL
jgi:uncharacterized delta-60 repeat protein